MNNNEFLNSVSTISSAINAYELLYDDINDRNILEQEAIKIMALICDIVSQADKDCVSNKKIIELSELGYCCFPLPVSKALSNILTDRLSKFISNQQIEIPIKIDYNNCFSMVLEINDNIDAASVLAQYILMSSLQVKQGLNFRCVDMVKGGSFFSVLHNLISKFPNKSGGRVFKSSMELDDLLKELDTTATKTIASLGNTFDSVCAYNQSNQVKLQEYVNVLYLNLSNRSDEEIKRIKVLLENRKKNGMSFILIGDCTSVGQFFEFSDYYFRYTPKGIYAGFQANLPFNTNSQIQLSDVSSLNLEENMQRAEFVDTIYANHPELHTDYLTMDSTQALRIPFALDRNGLIQYFEIGGEAPSHALLSGSTGSGKSVALHTLIMQIIYNYHPDDVEIWAIDYKAVEFDWYIQHKTPHFRVIAHDTSMEFSLSLLDLLYEEYESRMQKFLNAGVKNIGEYRKKMGAHSMPRIIVFIDEFQIMTQAVQAYTGNTDYRTVLENLLKLTRAMGISFVLCSQTIASGLSGLTESARDQIGCRLCLKHDDDNEIRETLMLSGPESSDAIARAKNLRKGQGIYKRSRWANEHAADGKSYEYKNTHILYISDEIKEKMIADINAQVNGDFVPKQEIFVRGGGRIAITEKHRHPIQQFINNNYEADDDCVEWYPAAPTTLADSFCIKLENTSGANILIVGENDDLRESIVVHSLCGFLMNPENRIVVSIVDENYADRKRMVEKIKLLESDRLILNVGIANSLNTIAKLKKIRANGIENTIYIWYGLDKIKNEIFLLNQDAEDTSETPSSSPATRQEMMEDLLGFLADINGAANTTKSSSNSGDSFELTYDDCKAILRQAFEVGPENNQYHIAIFNNFKSLKKSGMIELDNFENRIGSRMSVDDSYELFGSSLAINKTDDNTVIYYAGSGQAIPLRPYLLPDIEWFDSFNAEV